MIASMTILQAARMSGQIKILKFLIDIYYDVCAKCLNTRLWTSSIISAFSPVVLNNGTIC